VSGCSIGPIGTAALALALRGDALVERVRVSARDVVTEADSDRVRSKCAKVSGVWVIPTPPSLVGLADSAGKAEDSGGSMDVPRLLDLTVPRPHRSSLSDALYSSPWPEACKVALALSIREATGCAVPTDVLICIYEFIRVPVVRCFELTSA
jgi:hypothetical protein